MLFGNSHSPHAARRRRMRGTAPSCVQFGIPPDACYFSVFLLCCWSLSLQGSTACVQSRAPLLPATSTSVSRRLRDASPWAQFECLWCTAPRCWPPCIRSRGYIRGLHTHPCAVRAVRPCGAEHLCVQSSKHSRGRWEAHEEGNGSGAPNWAVLYSGHCSPARHPAKFSRTPAVPCRPGCSVLQYAGGSCAVPWCGMLVLCRSI